jgi:hypothetical protein
VPETGNDQSLSKKENTSSIVKTVVKSDSFLISKCYTGRVDKKDYETQFFILNNFKGFKL